ncbi:MAG: hypothetical protein U0P45_07215 [Acidimicrobiales bacterium]
MSPAWPVERFRGPAAAFHERPIPEPAGPALWWFEVERPSLVLGSTQPSEVVDLAALRAAGTDVARRRSGGGAVHLVPGATTWVDVILPASDPRWTDDVGRSFGWLGDAWASVLARLGHPNAEVHAGELVRTRWSGLVCFAGLGPGEVRLDGRKVLGISQRRTRGAARFQCALLHRWEPLPMLELLSMDEEARLAALLELAPAATGVGAVEPAEVVALLAEALAGP